MSYRTLHEIVRQARHNLDRNAWDYLVGGADSETTVRRIAPVSTAWPTGRESCVT